MTAISAFGCAPASGQERLPPAGASPDIERIQRDLTTAPRNGATTGREPTNPRKKFAPGDADQRGLPAAPYSDPKAFAEALKHRSGVCKTGAQRQSDEGRADAGHPNGEGRSRSESQGRMNLDNGREMSVEIPGINKKNLVT